MKSNVALWLYGSRARGDADSMSDSDVLAVAHTDEGLQDAISGIDLPKLNVSFYTWNELERMRSYGSLYLLHIAREGRCLEARCCPSAHGEASEKSAPILPGG
jgi:predicted nucleotidyltransferase